MLLFLFAQAVGEIEQVYFENTTRHTMASTIYNVHLYPSLYLKNFLPIDIIICLPGVSQENLLEASASLQLPTIDPAKSSIIIKVSACQLMKIKSQFLEIYFFEFLFQLKASTEYFFTYVNYK